MGSRGTPLFFNPHDAATIEAIAARIIPGSSDDPGAREADVIVYIDRAVAGYDHDLQPVYRRGVWELDRYCADRYGMPFVELPEESQDKVLHEISAVPAHPTAQVGETEAERLGLHVLSRFFSVVRQHTIEGMFCDPAYGGNRDGVGWKLVGFPGARWGYSEDEMQLGFDATEIPVTTLADLRREHGDEEGAGA